jgi:small subunit ribosomal protein S17
MYGKVMRKTPHYYAHDEKSVCNEGDVVRIQETRPLSRHKRWRVLEVVKKAV